MLMLIIIQITIYDEQLGDLNTSHVNVNPGIRFL